MNTAPFEARLREFFRDIGIRMSDPVYRNSPEAKIDVIFDDSESLKRLFGKKAEAVRAHPNFFVRKWKAGTGGIAAEYLMHVDHDKKILDGSDPENLEKCIRTAISRGKVRETCNLFLEYPYSASRGTKRDFVVVLGTMGGKFRSRGPYKHQNHDGPYNPARMADIIEGMVISHYANIGGN